MNHFPHVKRLFSGAKKQNLAIFILALIPNGLAAILEGFSFGAILLALKAFNRQQSWDIPFAPSFIINWLHPLPPQDAFIALLGLAIGLQICRSLLSYGGGIAMIALGTRVQISAQMEVYRQILSLSFPCASRYKTGDLLEYAKIPANIVGLLVDPLNQLMVSSFAILASFYVMLTLSPVLTMLATFIFGAFGIAQKFVMSKISKASRVLAEKNAEFSKDTVQNLHGLRIIHTYNQQTNIMKSVLANLEQIAETTKKINLWTRSIVPFTEMGGIALVGFFLVLGAWFFSADETLLPILLTFIMLIHRINAKIQTALTSIAAIALNWGYVIRLEEILDKRDKEFNTKGTKTTPKFSQEILFRGVSLRYEKHREPSVSSVNLSIPRGSTIAFVGFSGAGKSSLLDLLLKLYEPSEGAIYIDGLDLQELDAGSWRDQMGVVSQDTFIFNESIAKNICFGCENIHFEKMIIAAKSAGAHEFIAQLPDGYQTIVGERGHRLSGGEKQRIALARALIREPEILIFDEATSSLDSVSELWIQKSLDRLKGQKTMIIVAHRLSTIFNADRIYVLDNGRIVESGKHEQLLTRKGKYARLWELQASRTIENKAKSDENIAEVST